MHETGTINVKIPVVYSDTFAYSDAIPDSTVWGNGPKTKAKLKARVEAKTAEAFRALSNHAEHLIATVNGEVLLVRYHCDCWGYSIAGPGRAHSSGVMGGHNFKVVLESARNHAVESYGGIAWEMSV